MTLSKTVCLSVFLNIFTKRRGEEREKKEKENI